MIRTLFLIFLTAIPGITQYEFELKQPNSAWVFPDLDAEKIFVDSLRIEFRFSGYGVYIESDYPVLDKVPLENGETIDLSSIQWIEFSGKRVSWKQYIAPAERSQYDDVDMDGYRTWSQIEVDCSIKDRYGQLVKSRLKRPEMSDVFLTGLTQRGHFNLQLDQENGKTVRLIMDKGIFVQCSANPAHRFRNLGWKFCPLCGSPLIVPQETGN